MTARHAGIVQGQAAVSKEAEALLAETSQLLASL